LSLSSSPLSLFLSLPVVPSFHPVSLPLSLSLSSKRAPRRSPFRLRGFARAFIMHAKFHAEALRLASNPLITRCLRAPACARSLTSTRRLRCVRVTIFKSAREHPLPLFSLSLSLSLAPPSRAVLPRRLPAYAPALRFYSLTLFPLSSHAALSRDGQRATTSGGRAARFHDRDASPSLSLSRRVATRKNPSRGRP